MGVVYKCDCCGKIIAPSDMCCRIQTAECTAGKHNWKGVYNKYYCKKCFSPIRTYIIDHKISEEPKANSVEVILNDQS